MIVATRTGALRGRQAGGYREFLGVPYADPPAPDHRFGPPRPLTGWTGVRDATAPGATATRPPMPTGLLPEPPVEGVNCLNLNIYTPSPLPGSGSGLPVLVWIHGGGFVTGCNSSPWSHGGRFARDGVVFVAINYRLGPEGFLRTDDGPANRGILDMVQALRWVRDNIAAFGGDPGQVTIAGQSAGAMSCLVLLACPAAAGTFRHVAAISPGSPALASSEEARQVAEAFCGELGVPAATTALNQLDLDRRLAVEAQLLPDGMSTRPPRPPDERAAAIGLAGLHWRPWLDGDVLTTEVSGAVGSAPIDALLIGTTTEEFNFTLWPADPPPGQRACEQGFANLGFGPAEADRYLAAAPSGTWAQALAQAQTDARFRIPVRNWADASAAAGRATYAYQFAWRAPHPLGAAHCLDLPFFFGNLDVPGAAEVLGSRPPRDLATSMHTALVRFVATGDPGWAAYRLPDRATMVFDQHADVASDPFPV